MSFYPIDPNLNYNPKNTSTLNGKLVVKNDATVLGELYADKNIFMEDKLQYTIPELKDTLFIDGNFSINDIFTVNSENGEVNANRIVVDTLNVQNIEFGDHVVMDGTLDVNTLDANIIKAGEISADIFNVDNSNFKTIHVSDAIYNNGILINTGPASFYGGLYATTIDTNSITSHSGTFYDLSVTNDISLGGEIKTLDPDCNDTIQIEANLNVGGVINVDITSGDVTIPNRLIVDTLNVQNIEFGDHVVMDGTLDVNTLNATIIKADEIFVDIFNVDNSTFKTIHVSDAIYNNGILIQTGPSTFYGDLTATDIYSQSINSHSGTFYDLSITNDISLGGEIKTLDPDCNDTIQIEANLNVGGVINVDITSGDVTIPNRLIVDTLNVQNIEFGDHVIIDGKLEATTLKAVYLDIENYGDINANTITAKEIISELIISQTGIFSSLSSTQLSTISIDAQTGTITTLYSNLITTNIINAQTGIFNTIHADFYGDINASSIHAQTGLFNTIQSDTVIANTGIFNNLYINNAGFYDITVSNDITLGNELKTLDPDCNDTLFIQSNLDVDGVFNINISNGDVTIPNRLIVDTLNVQNIEFGDHVVIDGTLDVGALKASSIEADDINVTNISISNANFDTIHIATAIYNNGEMINTGPVTIYDDLSVDTIKSTDPLNDTVFIEASLNVNNQFTVDNTTGLVQIANDLLVYGTIYGTNASITGTLEATTIDAGTIIANTGIFNNISITNASFYNLEVVNDMSLGGEIKTLDPDCNDTLFIQSNLDVAGVLTADITSGDVIIPNRLIVDTLTAKNIEFGDNLIIDGRIDIHETNISNAIIDTAYINMLTVNNEMVFNSISVTGTTNVKDLNVYGNVNINNIFTIDYTSGTGVYVGGLQVLGGVLTPELFADYQITIGDTFQVLQSNKTVTIDGNLVVNSLFQTGSTGYTANNTLRGQIEIPNGVNTVRVYNNLCTGTSLVLGMCMKSLGGEVVQSIEVQTGYFDVYMSGSGAVAGIRKVNWLLVN